MEVVRHDLGRHPVQRRPGGRWPGGTTRWLARCSRSPMWWLGDDDRALGHRDRALQLGADGEHLARRREGQRERLGRVARANGAAPAAGPASSATTESSQRMWIGRSWVSRPSASGPEAGDGVVVGVGDRLVAVVAARHHERSADAAPAGGGGAACRAGTAPSSGSPGADGASHRVAGAAGREHDRPAR